MQWKRIKNLLKILTRNSNPGHFFCGTVPRQEFNCYWGFSFFHRLDYEKIGGFNENFRGWGGEDADFYDRLEKAGNERTVVLNITDFIQHLDHNDELRVENHDIKDMNKSNYSNGLLSKNGLLFEKSKYNIININDNLVVLERIKWIYLINFCASSYETKGPSIYCISGVLSMQTITDFPDFKGTI